MKESLVKEMFIKLHELLPSFTQELASGMLTNDNVMMHEMDAGEILARKGHPCERLYYISRGGLQHYERTNTGMIITTDMSEPGDFLCVCSLETSGCYIENLRAVTHTIVLYIPMQHIRQQLAAHPQMQRLITWLHYYHATIKREKWLLFLTLTAELKLAYLHGAFKEHFYTAQKETLASVLGICKSKLYNLLHRERSCL